MRYDNLGDAKKQADKNAIRDDCVWQVWRDTYYKKYAIADEFTTKDYYWSKVVYTVKPGKVSSEELVALTPEQRRLVAAVLDPNEPGRDYYPGSEEAKISLWKRLTGRT